MHGLSDPQFIDVTPDIMTLTGVPGTTPYQADYNISGNLEVTDRYIWPQMSIASAYPSRRYVSGNGSTYHYFTPVACSGTYHPYGEIRYATGAKYETVTLVVQNPNCGVVPGLPL